MSIEFLDGRGRRLPDSSPSSTVAQLPRRGPGRPPRSLTLEPRRQTKLSMTDRERYILDSVAEEVSQLKRRRIWPGELVALLLHDYMPDLYSRFTADYDRLRADQRPRPLSDAEVAAHGRTKEDERQQHLRDAGLPDMQAFRAFRQEMGLALDPGEGVELVAGDAQAPAGE